MLLLHPLKQLRLGQPVPPSPTSAAVARSHPAAPAACHPSGLDERAAPSTRSHARFTHAPNATPPLFPPGCHPRCRQLSFNELVALYAITDVALVTSLRDGMNLGTFSSPFSKGRALPLYAGPCSARLPLASPLGAGHPAEAACASNIESNSMPALCTAFSLLRPRQVLPLHPSSLAAPRLGAPPGDFSVHLLSALPPAHCPATRSLLRVCGMPARQRRGADPFGVCRRRAVAGCVRALNLYASGRRGGGGGGGGGGRGPGADLCPDLAAAASCDPAPCS